METIIGTAAGVPYTALPPTGAPAGPAPLVVTWHMLDAPRTDAAFAAALPMAAVPAWRVHLGMPMCGARMVDGRVDAAVALIVEDPLLAFAVPIVRQAAAEFPAALAAVRDQLPVDHGPVTVLGASLGGAVALEVLTTQEIPVRAVALVNPAVRVGAVVGIVGRPYRWTDEARATAAAFDYVARAADVPDVPLLLVSGEQDHAEIRADAVALVDALGPRAELVTVPGVPHPLADEPGLEPAPQQPRARAVDEVLTRWLRRRLAAT